jgi:hypothetical protein
VTSETRGTLCLTYDGSPVTGPAVALSLCLLPRLYVIGVGDQERLDHEWSGWVAGL